jgi:hypothetical protein
MATTYLVFKQQPHVDSDEPDVWVTLQKTFTAASADAAKQAAAIEHGAGTYSATPARGWQPRTYAVESRAVAVKGTA